MRKHLIIISSLILSGCAQQRYASVTELKLGMQIFDVKDIHKGDLTPIGFESRQGYDLVQYRGWFYEGTEKKGISDVRDLIIPKPTPYKLTFELYPPITKIQCQYIAAKNNITDPNKIAELYSIEGLRPSKLIQIVLDEGALQRAAIKRQTAVMMSQMQQVQSNQQQMLQNQQQMQHQMQFDSVRRGR